MKSMSVFSGIIPPKEMTELKYYAENNLLLFLLIMFRSDVRHLYIQQSSFSVYLWAMDL